MRISDWSSDVCSSDLGQAAKGAIALLAAAIALSLILPAGGASNLFLILVGFAATAHFGLNWCRVMLLGPAGLPARGLGWHQPHWRFFGYGMLLFLVMMLSTRSEEHTSELQSLMRISYAVFCLKKKHTNNSSTTDDL